MSHLLVSMRVRAQRMGIVPLMLEFAVTEETAPYLVTSSSSLMWVEKVHPGPSVKAAVREISIGDLYSEIIEAVEVMGRQQEWGNVHPLTKEGLHAAIDHVDFYGLGPVELLIPRAHPSMVLGGSDGKEHQVGPVDRMPLELRPLIEDTGLPFRSCSWVPDGTIVVVPKDRTFVGIVGRLTSKKLAAVVHNVARGISIVRRIVPDELVDDPLGKSFAE